MPRVNVTRLNKITREAVKSLFPNRHWPDVSNWPASQTGSIGRSTKLPRRCNVGFSSRAIQIRRLSYPVVTVSIQAHTYVHMYTHPSIRNFTLGIFFSLVTSSELRNAASRLCAVFLPRRGVSSSFSPSRPAPPRTICFLILFSSRLFPLLPSAPSALPATELFLPPLSRFVSVSQHRELDPAGVSQRSRQYSQNMLSSLIFLTRCLRSGFIREALTWELCKTRI